MSTREEKKRRREHGKIRKQTEEVDHSTYDDLKEMVMMAAIPIMYGGGW